MTKKAIGLPVDVKAPEHPAEKPDWWRRSKHAKEIANFLSEWEKERMRKLMGLTIDQPFVNTTLTLDDLIQQFIRDIEKKRDRPLSFKSIEHFNCAAKFLKKYRKNIVISDIDLGFVYAFRDWSKTQPLSLVSLSGYFADYRRFFKYARSRGYIQQNVFEDVVIYIEKQEIRKVSPEAMEELFAFLYLKNRPLFDQVWCERMAGLRVTEAAQIKLANIDMKNGLMCYTQKGNRLVRNFPIPDALLINLQTMLMEDAPFVFHFRDKKSVGYYLKRATSFINIEQIKTHDFKKAYLQEIARADPSDRIFEMLAHHSPTVAQTVVEFYADADVDNMRKVVNHAQVHWLEKLELFRKQKDDGKVYLFSNPKSHGKRVDISL